MALIAPPPRGGCGRWKTIALAMQPGEHRDGLTLQESRCLLRALKRAFGGRHICRKVSNHPQLQSGIAVWRAIPEQKP